MGLGLCGRMQCSNIEHVAMSSILPRMARQRLMLNRQKKRRLGLKEKYFSSNVVIFPSFLPHNMYALNAQRQAEEIREEALSKAREKHEFRQRNLDAAGMGYCRELEMYIDCTMSSFSLGWKECCNDDIISLDHRPDTAELKRLDGSVKKNSAFVKKLVKIAT